MVIKERGKIKRSVSTHFSDLPNGFKRVFNFTLINLITSFHIDKITNGKKLKC